MSENNSDKEIQEANNILAGFVKAAMMDAVLERKMSQFKLAVVTERGPGFARLIVVPEEYDRTWPAGAPAGTVSKRGGG
jgi:hypothetical protein